MAFFDIILADWKHYRRWRGGTWYQLRDVLSGAGVVSQITLWSRNNVHGSDWEILDIETY